MNTTSTLTKLKVLNVDPDAAYARLVADSLLRVMPAGLEFEQADGLDLALERLAEQSFDAILLDPTQLDSEGVQSCRLLHALRPETPLVVLAPGVNEAEALQSAAAGAQDYLVKGSTDGTAVLRAIRFATARMAAKSETARDARLDELHTLRILLVEDNPGDALLLEESLGEGWSQSCQVVTVGRLAHALEALRARPFHAAVTDLALPDSGGLETCLALRSTAPLMPFLVHTGSHDENLAMKTLKEGASDYLVKGLESGQRVARGLRMALARQSAAVAVSEPVVLRETKLSVPRDPVTGPSRELLAQVTENRSRSSPVGGDAAQVRRYPLIRSLLAIPVEPGGRPNWAEHQVGVTCELSAQGLTVELNAEPLRNRFLVVGVERRDGLMCYAGAVVQEMQTLGASRLQIETWFGGPGQDLLDAAAISPSLDPATCTLRRTVEDDVLHEWSQIKVLRPMLLDRVHVCPRCQALPSFRAGCLSCGSGRVLQETMIHHFKCAHVAPVAMFERLGGLCCPKCRIRNLIVGADFEYQTGTARCLDCHWRGAAPEAVAQCLRCSYRFPGKQASTLEVTGYHVDRLDPLAFIAAP